MHSEPYLIEFPKIGNSVQGYISVAEKHTLPFEPKRIYWTYFTPESVERGGHAHYGLEQIMVAVAGKIIVNTEQPNGKTNQFILESPSVGLYFPRMVWHTMKYTHNAVQMCIANMEYREDDYIRDYEKFKSIVL